MSKKKSLGSSPIGFQSESSTMGFIPDLGVSTKSEDKVVKPSKANRVEEQWPRNKRPYNSDKQKQKPEKKIVSYNLEVDLVEKIKSLASKKDLYYSSLVSMALKSWIAENG